MWSSKSRASARAVPGATSNSLRSMMMRSSSTGKSSSRPSSFAPQIMPKDITPRSLAGSISTGSPSPCQRTIEPGTATATNCSGSRLEPPQTICKGSSVPTSVMTTRKRSASGCCSTEMIRPTTRPSKSSRVDSTPSTSTVLIVRSWASCEISKSSGKSI